MTKPAITFSEETKSIIEQISALTSKLEQKNKALDELRAEIQTRDEKLTQLRSAAEETLLEGKNPATLLQNTALINLELSQLQNLLESSSEAHSAENKELERLKKHLAFLLRSDFNSSSFRRQKQQEFQRKIFEIRQLAEDVKTSFAEIGKTYDGGVRLEARSIFEIDDRSLYFWANHELSRIRLLED